MGEGWVGSREGPDSGRYGTRGGMKWVGVSGSGVLGCICIYLTDVPYGRGGGMGRLGEPGNVGENVLHGGGIVGSGQQG